MQTIATKDAVGMRLVQDVTQIIPGEKKGPRFKKGHLIKTEDVPILLSMGKENLYVWTESDDMLHEEAAAEILYQMCASENVYQTDVSEGKIEAKSKVSGLLKVDVERLKKLNSFGEMMIATKPTYFEAEKDQTVAGMRVIPLFIEKEKMNQVVELVGPAPLLEIAPFKFKKVAIVTTGSEIFKGRIKDGFEPVLRKKMAAYPTEIVAVKIVDDQLSMIKEAINEMLAIADIVLCTGGMSVDADDLTPRAIKESADDFVTYGTPVLPGAMFALAYTKTGQAIMGLPGSVIFAKRTVFDLIFPRIMADIPVDFSDIADLGHGGLL